MKSFAVLALFASLVAQGYAVTINTPASLVQCQPALLTWSDGTAPYFLSILPGGQPSATALESFDSTEATQMTWTVDIAAGTSVTLALRDSTGEQVFSDAVTISSSSDDSCVGNSSAASASGASGDATSAASGSASPATTGSETSSAATRAASQASGSTTGTSSTSTISNSHAAGSASSTSHSFSASRSTSSSSPSAGSADASDASAESANSAMRGSTMNAAGIAGLLGFIGAALL